jgi:hypothetical protein
MITSRHGPARKRSLHDGVSQILFCGAYVPCFFLDRLRGTILAVSTIQIVVLFASAGAVTSVPTAKAASRTECNFIVSSFPRLDFSSLFFCQRSLAVAQQLVDVSHSQKQDRVSLASSLPSRLR